MTEAAKKIEEAEDRVSQRAKFALRNAGGDVHYAARLLEKEVRGSAGLFREMMEPLIASACLKAVEQIHRTVRQSVWQGRKTVEENADGVRYLAAGNLLMFPLPGGKRLGDAGRTEIEAASDSYQKQADDMGHKARWLRLVAQSVPADKCAKDVLTDERLRELQVEARNG